MKTLDFICVAILVIVGFTVIILATKKSVHESYTASYEIDSVKVDAMFYFNDDNTGLRTIGSTKTVMMFERTGTRAFILNIADSTYRMIWDDGWKINYQNTTIHLKELE